MLKEFPDVRVELNNHTIKNLYVMYAFPVVVDLHEVPLISALANPIEKTRRFLGGSLDSLIYTAGIIDPSASKRTMEKNRGTLIKFIEGRLVLGVVLSEPDYDAAESVLRTRNDAELVLSHGDEGRTVFVPSPEYTKIVYRMDYSEDNLRRVVDFREYDRHAEV